MAETARDLHIAVFPWSAFGHMIPFHQLSIVLAKHCVCVSYIQTARNIDRLPEIPKELVGLMQYVCLPLTEVRGLPKGAEATVDMEFDEIPYLKLAYDHLQEPFKDFISSHSPDWVITDFAAHWLHEIITEEEHRVRVMYFSVYSASTLAFSGPPEYLTGEGQAKAKPTAESMTGTPEWATIFPPSVVWRGYEAAKLHPGLFDVNASGITDGERIARLLGGCQAIVVRSCSEFEGEYIQLYQSFFQIPVLPVGLLPPTPITEKENGDGTWNEALKWLDQQCPRSVIYVGFGSEYKLTKDEVYEIAYGLELANCHLSGLLGDPPGPLVIQRLCHPGSCPGCQGKGS